MPGPPLDDVARMNLATQNAFHGRVLALEDARRALEGQDRGIHARRLHDAAILGDIAVEHG
jgi:hypothetical protein